MRWIEFILPLAGVIIAGCTSEVSGPNRPPVAMAGEDVWVQINEPVNLSGAGSYDPDGDGLNYRWALVAVPPTTQSSWQEARGKEVSFTPDRFGIWVVRLVVSDGKLDSLPDIVKVYVEGQPCTSDDDCQVADACNIGRCREELCVVEPADPGTTCDDGLFCTVNDACNDTGDCVGGDERDCSHLDSGCNLGICLEESLNCERSPANDGDACEDGVYCTEGEACLAGVCRGGSPRSCDDSDPCTRDTCEEATDSCSHVLQPNPGAEEPWDAPECGDGQDNDCDGLTDGQDPDCRQCFSNDDCDDLNPCTQNTCEAEQHTCTTANHPDGTTCDDGLYCTDPDACANGACLGGGRDCSGVANTCNLGVCNEQESQCQRQPLPGTPCGDQADRECDDPDICDQQGQCDPVLAPEGLPCNDTSPQDCYTSQCDAAGVCDQQHQQLPDGQSCDDGNPCASSDRCEEGNCLAGTTDLDGDGDGHFADYCPGGDDCNDQLATVNPGQTEGPVGDPTCSDVLDNDCDGLSDGTDPDCQDDDWWDSNWKRRRKLTFDNSAQNENLDEFPVLIVLFQPDRIDYGQIQDQGEDLRFVDADNSNTLAYEIEAWDEGGNSYVWVKVPRVDASSNQDFIWMYYGHGSAGDDQDAPAVWSDGFRAVWHLNEEVIDELFFGTHRDSTGNGNSGSQYRNNNVAGMIADGQRFDGSEDYIAVDQGGLQITGQAITIEAWAKPTGNPNSYWHVYGAGNDGRYWQLWWNVSENGWAARYRISWTQQDFWTNSGLFDDWNYLACRYDGSAIRLFLNASEIGSTSAFGNLNGINSEFRIGDNPNLSPREFEGIIDEVRISDVVRSQAWIAAQHKSMRDDNFVIYGSEEVY